MTDAKQPKPKHPMHRYQRIDVCAVCGRESEEHHDFIPTTVTMPLTCKCDPHDWRDEDKIPAVCGSYEDDPEVRLCKSCQHMEECHAEQKP